MLTGKIALITGASRGIGRGCAVALAQHGVDIAVNYRVQEEEARKTCALVEGLGRRAMPVQADVSLASDVEGMIRRIEEGLGPIDILVNNAGIARRYPWDAIPEAGWDETLAVNLKSAYLVTQAVLPGMRARKWGRIVNIASGAAATGGIVGPYYAASKAGLLGLTHGYASFVMKEGITVNAVAPSLIRTDMSGDHPVNPSADIPVGRYGTIPEVADVVVMLAKNGYMTGQTIFVNGGRYMT